MERIVEKLGSTKFEEIYSGGDGSGDGWGSGK